MPAPLRGMGGAMIAPHTIQRWSVWPALLLCPLEPVSSIFVELPCSFLPLLPKPLLPLLLMFAVLYFVMIRPQMKKQKEHRAMIEALAKGDEVVTAGGLLGKVSKIGDAYIGVELATGVEVQLQRNAVVQVLPKGTIK